MDRIPLTQDRKDSIEQEALRLLENYNITKPVVNAVDVAQKMGITVAEVSMPPAYKDVAGFYNKDSKTIYVAAEDSATRKLFTVAHEIGHVLLGHENYSVIFRMPRQDAIYPSEEKESNIFAADFLMPEFMLREYMEKYNLTTDDYKRLATIFGVPISSMKHQLKHLGL